MSFDRAGLEQALSERREVARVVVAETSGSVPREVGAAMLVWPDGQAGTIGGGALEHDAAARARAGERGLRRVPLGPGLGQCCGGAVTLLTEYWTAADLGGIEGDLVARPARTEGGAMPLAVRRLVADMRSGAAPPRPALVEGWMVEPVTQATRPLWIWGAGHVGRALVEVLAPLPDLAITWVDTAPERFPDTIPAPVTRLVAAEPTVAAAHAPVTAEHLILTYSHALDLALCDALLTRGFARAGLIGSDTKRARFRSRLRDLGHADAQISRIRCPIGQKTLGKHPQAIAVGVAAEILSAPMGTAEIRDTA
ncbi:xanthine dehydrogenase accessory protein XdhC [Tranquillimonas rosea]|uniref:xanthine dehydrogenase accessory protein XdhC n=1 Tax=Tranquillimonas rosea TaxID=641238 RepID=UPI003BAA84BB